MSIANNSPNLKVKGDQYCVRKDGNKDKFEDDFISTVEEVKKILENLYVIIPEHCEQFIVRCIRVKNHDAQKAAYLVKNFGTMMGKAAMSDVFANFKPILVKGLYESKALYPLSKRDSKGRLIIVGLANLWNPEDYDFDQALASLIMLFNFGVANSIQVQREGVIFILDFSKWSFRQVKAVKIGTLKIIVQFLQNSTPGKIKAYHLINYPKVIQLFFALVKPFIKTKLANRIHFHGNDPKALLKYFEPKILPERLGGTNIMDCADDELLRLLYGQDQYYQDLVHFKYPAY